jgi:F0F1-type ATP synthase assembly protein I
VEQPLQEDERKSEPWRFYGAAISLGLNMAVGVAVFTFIGHLLDRWRGGGKAWTLCGIFVGLLYGAYEVWKMVRQIEQEDAERKRQGGKPKGDVGP